MAVSREFIRRLYGNEEDEEPLAKRLKLAENAFVSEDLSINRKEDIILKWLCETATRKDTEVAHVWDTLARCLKFKDAHPDSILKSDTGAAIVEAPIKRLSKRTKRDIDWSKISSYCETIFTSGVTRRYFCSHAASLGRLLEVLLHRSIKSLYDDSTARKCLFAGLDCLVICYKRSIDKDEYTLAFVRQILFPLATIAEASSRHGDKLGAEIHKRVRQLIFDKSRRLRFASNETIEDKDDFASRFFMELRNKAEEASSREEEDAVVAVFSCLLRAALTSYKNDPAAADAIFRRLVDSAANRKIQTVARCRELLVDIGLDYESKIDDLKLFDYLLKIRDEIVSTERLGCEHYEALSSLATVNPLLVDTGMEKIYERILLAKRDTSSEYAAYRRLMIVLVEAGTRLRREQKLVSWILTALEATSAMKFHDANVDFDAILPIEFKKRLGNAIGDMTSAQAIGVFRTLLYHLDKCAESFAKDEKAASFILRANVELISAYFEGVRIFDGAVSASAQEKFVQGLRDLEKTLTLLSDAVSKIHDKDERVVAALLNLVQHWDLMRGWMRHYAPDALPRDLELPISEDRWRCIVANIDDVVCKNAMNDLLVQRIGRIADEDTPSKLSNLLGGLESTWTIILDRNPQILSSMDNSQIIELARHLLNYSSTATDVDRLGVDAVQNDPRFVKALVLQALFDTGTRINESTTKTITMRVNVVKCMKRKSLSKLVKEMKNDLSRKTVWGSFDERSLSVIEERLKILLRLPLRYLSADLRTILLLVAYTMKKECGKENATIRRLCIDVTMDVSEKPDIDIIDSVDPDSLIHELVNDRSAQRIVELSLRNVTSWEALKSLTKQCWTSDTSVAIFFDCLERAMAKLKNDEREIVRKAEKRLCKKLLETIDEESLERDEDPRRLILAVKVSATSLERVPDNLLSVTKAALHRIFVSEAPSDEEIAESGLQLAIVVFKHGGKLELSDEIVDGIWECATNDPCKEIVQPLLERTKPKSLSKLLASLRSKTILGLEESKKDTFTSAAIVWEAVMNCRMGAPRHKLRALGLHDLLQALLIAKIDRDLWPNVLKLVESMLSEALSIIDREIDPVTLLAGRSLREAGLSVCDSVLAICSSLVKFHTSVIVNRLPILLRLYREIVNLVVRESRINDDDPARLRRISCLAHDVEKFTNTLVKLKKDLARISPYMIADLVELFSEGVIPPRVKGPLEDSVGHLLGVSDQHAVSLLSRTLPTATQVIFRTLYDTYNKFYKFTGRI